MGDWLSRYNLTRLLADSLHMTDEGNNALGVLLGQRLQEMGIRAEDTAASR